MDLILNLENAQLSFYTDNMFNNIVSKCQIVYIIYQAYRNIWETSKYVKVYCFQLKEKNIKNSDKGQICKLAMNNFLIFIPFFKTYMKKANLYFFVQLWPHMQGRLVSIWYLAGKLTA